MSAAVAVAVAVAAAPTARKRPATDQPRAADAKKKRPRRTIDEFEVLDVLGEGAEGVVSRALDRRTGKEVALKWIRGDGPDGHGPPDRRALAMEVGCLRACRGHPSIIGIHELAADPNTGDVHLILELIQGGLSLREFIWHPNTGDVHLILELIQGGLSLREFIWQEPSEDGIRAMMRQLLSATKTVHDLGFIHRDVKSENILVSPQGELKLCDFGSATRKKPDGEPHQAYPVGTLQYNAPELLDRNWCYGPAIDMWGLGCVMAELLSGETLFQAESEYEMTAEMSELRDRMTSAAGKLDPECLKDLSEDGRDVLKGLLAFYPEKRLTAAEALEHRWFKNSKAASD